MEILEFCELQIEKSYKKVSHPQENIFKEYHEKWKSCDDICQNWNFYVSYGLKKIERIT